MNSPKRRGCPSKHRRIMAPHEYEAVISVMQKSDAKSREAARQVLVNGALTTEAARAYGLPVAAVSGVIQSILRARQKLLRAMELFNNGNSTNSNSVKGETK